MTTAPTYTLTMEDHSGENMIMIMHMKDFSLDELTSICDHWFYEDSEVRNRFFRAKVEHGNNVIELDMKYKFHKAA